MRGKTTHDTYYNGSMAYRTGIRTARKVLGGDVEMSDYNEYGPSIEWTGPNGCCWTNHKGDVVHLWLE